MRQKRWIEYIKDYDYLIDNCSSKGNVVADALSHKYFGLIVSKDQVATTSESFVMEQFSVLFETWRN